LSSRHHTLYAIGKIEKAFGVKGEVVVRMMTPSPGRFKKLKHVYVGNSAEEATAAAIEFVHMDARGVRLGFVDIVDRTSAEHMVGNLIFVDERELIKPPKGSYFIHDMVGLKVIDENNMEVGVVKDVLRLPAQDIYVVEKGGREWMLPAVKEFVTSVDVPTRVMRVRLIDGMMEV
jgi:16S rRNA processing protein RimM